jgi:FkbM family methyltransferase
MRQKLNHVADSLGARRRIAHYRDLLVRVLTGDKRWGTSERPLDEPHLDERQQEREDQRLAEEAREQVFDHRMRLDNTNLGLLLAFGLRSTSNCLDVGANRGLFLRDCVRVAPEGHHLAYEPIPALHDQLVQEFPGVDIRQRALSDADGATSFVHVLDEIYDGYSGFKEVPYPVEVRTEQITVETERLDDHLPDGWLPDFVKIDVEGAEGLVLAGGIDTLRKARPVVAVEHGWGGGKPFGWSDEQFYEVICNDIGLRLFDMDGGGPFDLTQFLDQLHTGEHWNWIAHT